MTNAEKVCGSCDCSDPTTIPELRLECSCGCHGRRTKRPKCNQDRGIRGEEHYAIGWPVIVTDSHGEYKDVLCTKCCDRAKANGCEVRNA